MLKKVENERKENLHSCPPQIFHKTLFSNQCLCYEKSTCERKKKNEEYQQYIHPIYLPTYMSIYVHVYKHIEQKLQNDLMWV